MSKCPKTKATLLVDASVASLVLGLSRRQFDRLVKLLKLARAGRLFDLTVVGPLIVRYVRDDCTETETMARAKLKHIDAQRRAVEQRTAARRLELVPADEVVQREAAIAAAVIAAIRAMARRVAVEIPNTSTYAQRDFLCREAARVTQHSLAAALSPGQIEPLEFLPEEIPGAPHQWQGATFAAELQLYREELRAQAPDYFQARARHYAAVAIATEFAKLGKPDDQAKKAEASPTNR